MLNLDNFSSKLILITKLISIKIKNIQISTYSDSGVIFVDLLYKLNLVIKQIKFKKYTNNFD